MPAAGAEVVFGEFRLVPQARTLYRQDRPVRLSGRAFDLLLALVERAGAVVGKDELIARVWPHTVVEEGNLRVHVGALRKALGDDQPYVENVVGRGYCFVAPLRMPAVAQPLTDLAAALPLQRLTGRDAVLAQLAAQVPAQRLLTIVGPGGMGKSVVALAVAARVAAVFDGAVYCADLAGVMAPAQLSATVARLLGLAADANPGHWLRPHRALLVLDGCEHLVDAVAALAERLLLEAPRVHILATSREPLRAEGEWVYRLAPLALPPADDVPVPAQLAAYPSVQLFAERAGADGGAFAIDAGNAAAVADICRRLDGIPLALELAAGRAAFFGVHELALRLSDCFAVLTRGRRTALPRHQTLRATLDWSYDLLTHSEQAVLRRLAVFGGGFTLEAAVAVGQGTDLPAAAVAERIANLTAKSLIGIEPAHATVQYRLLRTTRSYALEKLQASGEEPGAARAALAWELAQ
ncbi:winged helix-turn-helix domain-containing protein [Pseudoduganella plicata]|nr:winged helix-turn-helix domain-containing protein [Pseudoduganella plicata]GGY94383.1 hypothetical protein GCM10007388_29480 [Pseudoduganella plicata]